MLDSGQTGAFIRTHTHSLPQSCVDTYSQIEVVAQQPVVLWRHEPVTCTCATNPGDNTIEIRLMVDDVTIHCSSFTDAEDAARFAIEKMHAYNAN
jgi:hypothetical protein